MVLPAILGTLFERCPVLEIEFLCSRLHTVRMPKPVFVILSQQMSYTLNTALKYINDSGQSTQRQTLLTRMSNIQAIRTFPGKTVDESKLYLQQSTSSYPSSWVGQPTVR
ncbi:hypothetical protein Plhal703r1_c48g0151321 [Plasmopara halstedii]